MTNLQLLETFGARIYNNMSKNGITLKHMALVTGTHPRSFRRIIDGEVAAPQYVLDKIVQTFANDKKLAKYATEITTVYGEKGSASKPMGSNCKFAERVAPKVTATITVPFNLVQIAEQFGLNAIQFAEAITAQGNVNQTYQYERRGETKTLIPV